MELVLLADVQNGYGSTWIRIANTTGVSAIGIGDRFREQGFGAGAEEFEVDGVDISPVGGLSRLHVIRGAGATQPMTHRLGAVFEQVNARELVFASDVLTNATSAVSVTNQPTNGSASAEALSPPPEGVRTEPLVPLKRGRGRPKGSRNKTKQEVVLPVGFR